MTVKFEGGIILDKYPNVRVNTFVSLRVDNILTVKTADFAVGQCFRIRGKHIMT